MSALVKLSTSPHLHLIKSLMLFTSLDQYEQDLVASRSSIVHYEPEKIVVDQGEIADTFYAIIKGNVLISIKTNSKGWIRAGNMGAGNVFGEIAILKNIPRIARVTTITPCDFLILTAKNFLEIYHFFSAKARDNIQLIIAKQLAKGRYISNL